MLGFYYNFSMELKKVKYERATSIISFLFVFSVFIGNIVIISLNAEPKIIIPAIRYCIPVIHGICSILSFIIIFKFSYAILFSMLQLESIICIITKLEILGIFFYFISIFLIFLIYYQTKPVKYIVCISYAIHIFLLGCTFTYGWQNFLLNVFTSCYMFVLFLWVYNLLKVKFSCFKPSMIMNNSTIGEKIPGTKLKLSDYNLSERQISFTLDFINNNLSYNDLTEKYYVSLSTVKKEFAEVFKIFGVTKNDELKLLLLQYVVEK